MDRDALLIDLLQEKISRLGREKDALRKELNAAKKKLHELEKMMNEKAD